jgi:hypothetical protein
MEHLSNHPEEIERMSNNMAKSNNHKAIEKLYKLAMDVFKKEN